MKQNRVIGMNLRGGWIAGMVSSPKMKLEKELVKLNREGWSFKFALDSKPNPAYVVLSMLCALVTLGAIYPIPSYMFIVEKEVSEI